MNPDPNREQELKEQELQRMLALKRLEAPPPRYFRAFSERVIDRLQSPEPTGPLSLRQRLGLDIDSRPVLVCASGVAVCSLLVIGLIASLRVAPPKPAPRDPFDRTHLVVAPPPSPTSAPQDPAVPVAAAPSGAPLDVPVRVPASPLEPQKPSATHR